ncbi:MAG TPA: hypothetical protein VJ806_13150 [Luteimonas sp.]|nr:hypothetical protein [Luteimonas sp.]
MKNQFLVIASTCFALTLGVGNASASRAGTDRTPEPRPEQPSPRCKKIGSDIWECEVCIEDYADYMSYCYTYISKNVFR